MQGGHSVNTVDKGAYEVDRGAHKVDRGVNAWNECVGEGVYVYECDCVC